MSDSEIRKREDLTMFVDIKKAVKDLKKHDKNEDMIELRYHVMRGEISAYIKTPKISETPGYNDGEDIDIFRVPCPLDSFFDQRLSEYCKITDPVWEDGRISFTTIVVTDLEGKSPTRKNPRYTGIQIPPAKSVQEAGFACTRGGRTRAVAFEDA